MPTNKSKEIEDMLTNITGISRQEAAKKQICTWCKKPLGEFRNPISAREAQISGFCQKCQDETFGAD